MSGAVVNELRAARRRLAIDSIGIWVLAAVIGTIFGFTAREGGLSLIETAAFSAPTTTAAASGPTRSEASATNTFAAAIAPSTAGPIRRR